MTDNDRLTAIKARLLEQPDTDLEWLICRLNAVTAELDAIKHELDCGNLVAVAGPLSVDLHPAAQEVLDRKRRDRVNKEQPKD